MNKIVKKLFADHNDVNTVVIEKRIIEGDDHYGLSYRSFFRGGDSGKKTKVGKIKMQFEGWVPIPFSQSMILILEHPDTTNGFREVIYQPVYIKGAELFFYRLGCRFSTNAKAAKIATAGVVNALRKTFGLEAIRSINATIKSLEAMKRRL